MGTGTAFAATAYDPTLADIVVVDGCLYSTCGDWSTDWMSLLTIDGWVNVTPGGPNPGTWDQEQYMWGSSMAYDPVDNELVLFGGISYANNSTVNWTFVYSGSTWTNITATSPSCSLFLGCCYPTDRYGASMTWDGQIGDIVLTGGYSSFFGEYLNDTWYFIGGVWYDSLGFFGSIPGPQVAWMAAMPTNSTDIAPLEFGGYWEGAVYNTSWILDIPPAPVITNLAPNPADVGAVVNFTAAHTVGAGSGPYLTAYGGVGLNLLFAATENDMNFSTRYAFGFNTTLGTTGLNEFWAEEVDFFLVDSISYLNDTVNANVTAAPYATPNPTEVGTSTTFTSAVSLGTPAYGYLWNFGDGSPASHAIGPTHTYAAPGDLTAWLNVTDTGGGWTNQSFAVTVYGKLAATAAPNVTATDVEFPVQFAATPAGGAPGADAYAWQFGDSTTGTGKTADHAYSHPGTFDVNVTVTDSLGFTTIAHTTVTVYPALALSAIDASSTSPTTTTSVTFSVTATGGTPTLVYAWTINGAASGSTAMLTQTFSSAGTYTIKVVVTDAVGASMSKTTTANVTAAPSSGILNALTTGDGPYYIIGLVAVVVAIVAALALMRRKKKGGFAAPPPPPAEGSATPTPPPPPGAT